MTPTLKGVNVDAIEETHTRTLNPAKWYDDQGHKLFQCMKKHLGHTHEGLPFMARGVNGIWGPSLLSILYQKLHWARTRTGWVDPAHPSEWGLNKYKEFAWDAVGEAGCLSIKILDGWNFTESTYTTKGTSFESYAREMKMLFSTTRVGHAIDWLKKMVDHRKKCVPLTTKIMLREIAPPGPNLAAERNTASGQGSGGMGEETSGKADAEARGRELKETWNKPASPPQKEVIDAERGWRLKHDAGAGARAGEQDQGE